MRPLRLEIEGFTSFREKAVLDFDHLDLFAITGPTGAGKSSLIDALVFALYGQVPRVGKEYRQLLSHGAERASVRLDFAVGAERYRVVRTIRSSGAAPSRLERVRPGPPEKTHGLADRVSEIEKQVERIVGLDYDAFTRSVVLPQGQFDAFLKGEPEERRKILVALLNLHVYKRMQEAANRRASEARSEADFIAGQLGCDYAGAAPEALEAKEKARAQAEAARDAAESTLKTLAKVAEVAQRVRAARREAEAREGDAREAKEALGRAEAAPGELRQRSEVRTREKQAIDARLLALACDEGRLRVLLGARPLARQLADLRPKRQRLEEAARQQAAALETQGQEAKAAEKKIAPAAKTVTKARQEVEDARSAREVLHRQHAAQQLRQGLKPGDPCPVCTQPVVLLPPSAAPPLAEADAAVRAAEARLATAQQGLSEAQLLAERAKGQVEKLEGEVDQARRLLEETDGELHRVRGGLQEAGFAQRALGEVTALVRAIESELAGLEKAHAERTKAEAERRRLEEDLAGLATLLAAADAQIAALHERAQAALTRREQSQTRLREAIDELQALTTPSGLRLAASEGRDEADAAEGLRAQAHAELTAHATSAARLGAEAAELERRIARAAELVEKKKALEASAALFLSLAQHLRADQFLAYVLEEALRRLALDGSRHLRQLSQGRYSLECEGQEFFVLDHWNADARRSVKTLSGGETFLASLGLALALAESLASLSAEDRAGEALESLFLDEGFGTLDPETLAQVVQAIEQLQGGERLVGIVTHLPELAEQMPARVSVGRSDRGATLTVA
jgi:exonuclease SbcC